MRCTQKTHKTGTLSYPFANVCSSIYVVLSRFLFVWALPQFGGDALDRCLRISMRKPLSSSRVSLFQQCHIFITNQSARHRHIIDFVGWWNLARLPVGLKKTRIMVVRPIYTAYNGCYSVYVKVNQRKLCFYGARLKRAVLGFLQCTSSTHASYSKTDLKWNARPTHWRSCMYSMPGTWHVIVGNMKSVFCLFDIANSFIIEEQRKKNFHSVSSLTTPPIAYCLYFFLLFTVKGFAS